MKVDQFKLNLNPEKINLISEVLKAGQVLMSYWPGEAKNSSLKQESKLDGTLVTEADIAANDILISALKKYFPKDTIISEETGSTNSNSELPERVWYLDPLDGTKNFAAGMDDFLILICLVVNQEVDFSLAYFPAREELCLASKGQGAYTSKLGKISVSKDLFVPEKVNIRDISLGEGDFLNCYHTGAAQYLVATGQLAGCVYGLGHRGTPKVWDFAPFDLIISESGGKVTDQFGNKIIYQGEALQATAYLASNGIIHQDLLKLIK